MAGGRLRQAMENQEALAALYTLVGKEHNAIRALKRALPDVIQKTGSLSVTTNPSSRP